MNINIKTQTNGYTAEGLQEMIARFDKVAADLFPGCTVEHFYYGDSLDMADIIIGGGHYCHFNITAKRVRLNGLTGTDEDVRKWESMTYNDDLYDGNLVELAKA